MQRYEYEIKRWENTAAHHQIGSGKALKRLLEERCTVEFLNKYNVTFLAMDSTLQSSYIIIRFELPKGRIASVQMVGYTERPRWSLGMHDKHDKWITKNIPGNSFQASLEECFTQM